MIKFLRFKICTNNSSILVSLQVEYCFWCHFNRLLIRAAVSTLTNKGTTGPYLIRTEQLILRVVPDDRQSVDTLIDDLVSFDSLTEWGALPPYIFLFPYKHVEMVCVE